jgi:mycothiol synthase
VRKVRVQPVEPSAPEESWLETINTVRDSCRSLDGQDPLDEAASLRLRHHGLAGSSLWLASSSGFALAHAGGVDLAVAPAARREGLGSSLAAAALGGTAPVTAWSHGDHPAARVLAVRHGLRRARELWVMRRPASLPLPSLAAPAGVTIRAYSPADEPELLRVNAAAFAHHPEQGSMSSDDLAERMAEPWYSPAGLLVADSGSGLVGFHWTKQHSADLGEVYVVGVDPAAQGSGLGKALTLAGLEHLHALGVSEVLLYVESDNAPAVAVYSGLGFEHAAADTHVQYARP